MSESDSTSGYRLAALAARICPNLCQRDAPKAIKIAQRLLSLAEFRILYDETGFEDDDEDYSKNYPAHGFKDGVKIITREKRFDRAMFFFRRFVRSCSKTQKGAEKKIETMRAKYFTEQDIESFGRDFAVWKRN